MRPGASGPAAPLFPRRSSLIVASEEPRDFVALARAWGVEAGADLPLISARVLEGDSARLEALRRAAPPGLRLYEDPVLSLPDEPVQAPAADTGVAATRAPELWLQGFRGRGVAVAVIDTGVAPHRDLGARLTAFHDLVNGRTRPYDDHGHGTHVAGILAGDGSDAGGRHAGMAPEASVVAVKAFDHRGKARASTVIQAIQWAVANRQRLGIRILNLSAAGRARESYRDDPLAQAVEAACRAGLLTVVAAGNEGPGASTIGSPGHAPGALTVGAADDRGTVDCQDDRVADLSSRGPTVDGLPKPDLVAPGVGITSLAPGERGYLTRSGTSMAAPMVSGAAALLLSARPDTQAPVLRQALVAGARPLARGGDAHAQGAGLVDVRTALERLQGCAQGSVGARPRA
jgi:serine protease AprX